ncbi:putative aldouronate transport system permease protein [Pullulanibacillus pueri]|uniref:Putative ABC transporter permease protein YtcP n=1 Tax=Pullulanibacillus pueri TaxID=1437324 RepID=A0A8J3ENT5_9BACL|nr:carbohydrate ABC transporter permease [Pullulanibacillus pueri]MBM7684219.1 putative aldouronate transport system permease protein [Pullulanibacillus pueri]GGH89011.1 putative ABC transporter permease protein YtcP [Pullulanibacillus pueri]
MVRDRNLAVDIIIYGVLTLIAILCVAPILNTLALSFSSRIAAVSGKVFFLPVDFNLASYREVLKDHAFFRAFGVSVERVVLGAAINFIISVLMAYPLSKSRRIFPGRNIYMWLLIFTMLFQGGLIPLYMTINTYGLLDSIWALVLPTAVPVFNIILLVNFFKGIPKELEEAASIDGAGPWKILFYVYIPTSVPVLATITLFSVVFHWDSFFDGMIYMQHPENWPLQTYIQQVVVNANQMNNVTDPSEIKRLMAVSNQTLNAAKVFLSMIPILVFYPFLQRYFVSGIVLGSVKE